MVISKRLRAYKNGEAFAKVAGYSGRAFNWINEESCYFSTRINFRYDKFAGNEKWQFAV